MAGSQTQTTETNITPVALVEVTLPKGVVEVN